MVIYGSVGVENLVNLNFTMDQNGVQYVQMDLITMQEMLLVDN